MQMLRVETSAGICDLLRAIENRFFYVLSFTEVTVDVFNCDVASSTRMPDG